jgi:hypothetical protein
MECSLTISSTNRQMTSRALQYPHPQRVQEYLEWRSGGDRPGLWTFRTRSMLAGLPRTTEHHSPSSWQRLCKIRNVLYMGHILSYQSTVGACDQRDLPWCTGWCSCSGVQHAGSAGSIHDTQHNTQPPTEIMFCNFNYVIATFRLCVLELWGVNRK